VPHFGGTGALRFCRSTWSPLARGKPDGVESGAAARSETELWLRASHFVARLLKLFNLRQFGGGPRLPRAPSSRGGWLREVLSSSGHCERADRRWSITRARREARAPVR
jgi:hypothetical protein